jgi:hypothetical protein
MPLRQCIQAHFAPQNSYPILPTLTIPSRAGRHSLRGITLNKITFRKVVGPCDKSPIARPEVVLPGQQNPTVLSFLNCLVKRRMLVCQPRSSNCLFMLIVGRVLSAALVHLPGLLQMQALCLLSSPLVTRSYVQVSRMRG